jgi:hypothetical protein
MVMTAQGFLSGVRRFLTPAAVVVLLACRGWSAGPEQKTTFAETARGGAVAPACHGVQPGQKAAPGAATAAELVRAALKSELAGDNRRRDDLLRRALYDSAEDPLVHWELGQVRVQGRWQSPTEVQQAAQQDKRLAEYGRRRDSAALTVADQADLARWCRKNRLDDQQRVHWMLVLQLQGDNAEAIQALALRPYQGMMLGAAQVKQLKAQQQKVWKAIEDWRLLVAQWRKAAEGRDPAIPAAVTERIAKIGDAAEMVALEGALWRQVAAKRQTRLYHDMTLAMMPVLGGNPRPAAAESLARYAAFSGFDDVRAAAVSGLKRHPLDHYVPLLLAGLQSPIDAGIQCTLSASGDLVTRYTVFQEGALTDVSSSLIVSPVYSDFRVVLPVSVTPGTGTVQFDSPQEKQYLMRNDPGYVAAAYAQAGPGPAGIRQAVANANAYNAIAAAENWQRNAQNARAQAIQSEAAMRDAVDRTNRAIAQRNAQIVAALGKTTGLDLGHQPLDWWTWWWQDYNEMYHVSGATDGTDPSQPGKPEYHYERNVDYGGSTPAYEPITAVGRGPVACSCFAAGTKVWTLTGRQPIEKIKIGDRVLAQEVETGELAYKPVLAVTTRPPGRWTKIGLGAESLTATPSHPFWVAGQGWRMTKQLAAGNRLHALSGGVPVKTVESLEADEDAPGSLAYNLIVADYDSYFVGDRGILVHDNTPRRPTAAILPGLTKQ